MRLPVRMNSLRLAVSLAGVVMFMAGAIRQVSGKPLSEPQGPVQPRSGVFGIAMQGGGKNSNLIRRVTPVYPEEAKAACISGSVFLLIMIEEDGRISEVRATSGHPLLVEASTMAVLQWQYKPTSMPIVTQIAITFSLRKGIPAVYFGGSTGLMPPPMLFDYDPVRDGGATRFYSADVIPLDRIGTHIVFKATPIDEQGASPSTGKRFMPPRLALDKARLQPLAEAGWPANVDKAASLEYCFFVNKDGQIRNVRKIQGPRIPEVENELARTKVVFVGRRGSTPVNSYCVVEFRLQPAIQDGRH